jgi:hypothetical protein
MKDALTMVAGDNNVRVVISLNPNFYAKYKYLAKNFASLTTVDVRYSIDDFVEMFSALGMFYLGSKEEYEKKIGTDEKKITDLLYARWGSPKSLNSYFDELARHKNINAVSLARDLKDKDYKQWIKDQLILLSGQGINLDFLFAIKLADLFGEDNKQKPLEQLQKDIFHSRGQKTELNDWFYRSSGRCFMHDEDMNALDFDDSSKSKIFERIEKNGFEDFLKSRIDRLDWSGYKELGKFFAQNTKYFIFNDLMTGAIGAIQTQEPPIQDDIISTLMEGIGVEFNSLTNAEKTLFLQHAKDHVFGARAEGTGVGAIFGSLSDDYKREVLEIARVNPEFAGSLGLPIGNSFGSLSELDKTNALSLAQENPKFAFWLGWGVGRSSVLYLNWIRRTL